MPSTRQQTPIRTHSRPGKAPVVVKVAAVVVSVVVNHPKIGSEKPRFPWWS